MINERPILFAASRMSPTGRRGTTCFTKCLRLPDAATEILTSVVDQSTCLYWVSGHITDDRGLSTDWLGSEDSHLLPATVFRRPPLLETRRTDSLVCTILHDCFFPFIFLLRCPVEMTLYIWKLNTVKKVCSRVNHIGSAILRKPSRGRPATAFSFYAWILKTWQGENDGYSWNNSCHLIKY